KDGVSLHLNMEISREEYEDLIRSWLNRTMDCVQHSLDDAHLTPRQIDKVVLVGGSTRMPVIARLLEQRLGQAPHCEVNPDLCVAMGASIQAGLIGGTEVGSVLVDITPHSLGIRCLDFRDAGPFGRPFEYKFAPIIRRNTPLPASRSEAFTTVTDRQPTVDIEIYQGEQEDVRRNHRVGRFTIDGLAPVPAGNQIVVQLDLNLDGILRVSAREKVTGLQKHITIENALRTVSDEERALATERLNRLWETAEEGDLPEDDSPGTGYEEPEEEFDDEFTMPELADAPREGQRETVQARALLEKAERIRDRVSPEDQAELNRLMEQVRVNLTDRKWNELTAASNELTDVLFYLEDV
ncbi:MAG TPA: Hsp70 family protein, partial [Gemmataceae bacterium]|nr:Hsp70 family protein [Gemmataceae bacterium]